MLAFMSYLTATFVIESMAAANAVVQWKLNLEMQSFGVSRNTVLYLILVDAFTHAFVIMSTIKN